MFLEDEEIYVKNDKVYTGEKEIINLIFSPSTIILDKIISLEEVNLEDIEHFEDFLKIETFCVYFLNFLIDSFEPQMISSNEMFFDVILNKGHIFPFHSMLNEKFIYYFDLKTIKILSRFNRVYPIPNKAVVIPKIFDCFDKINYFYKTYWKKNIMCLFKLREFLNVDQILIHNEVKYIFNKISIKLIDKCSKLNKKTRKEKIMKKRRHLDETDNEFEESPEVKSPHVDNLMKKHKEEEGDYAFLSLCEDLSGLKLE